MPEEFFNESGIWPPFEAFYIESMIWHTTAAKRAIDDVAQWLELVEKDSPQVMTFPKPELFERLQSILHQAGCLSRYFFPVRSDAIHLGRANCLRNAFGVDEKNPLSERGLRNAIEHFDERLDQYLVENQVGNFVPMDVGYEMPVEEVPLHIFKGFYVSTLTFVLLGKSYEMAPIVNEMLRIHVLLRECLEKGYRLPFSHGREFRA